MAQQAPWDAAPVVRQRADPRQNEREQAETRYRNTTGDANPLAQPPILPGEQGYAGPGEYLPQAGVVVRGAWDNAPVQTDSQKRAAAEAERRYGGDGGLNTVGQGTTFGFLDEGVGRLAQVEQMATNLGRRLTGQPIEIESRDLNDAVVETIRGGTEQFARERPATSFGLMALGAVPSGGAALGRGVGGAALTGGAYGALAGAGSAEGDVADRALPAALGGAVGGVAGGALGAATPYAQRLASIASAGTRRVIPARQSVAERFAPMIDDAALAERARLQELGLRPSVMDVLPQRAERLVRTAAGPAGPGAEAAIGRSRDLTQNLKSDVMSDTRALTGDPRSASQVREGLLETRSTLAEQQYAPAYAARVPVTDDLVSALSDEPGRAALRRARAAAVARRNDEQIGEIDRLLAGDTSQDISAGTLDRVRIAMSGRAQAMQQRPDTRDIAGGLFNRAGQLDETLELVPELAPARATYRNLSGAVDALDEAGQVFSLPPQDFEGIVRSLTPEQREAAIIGVRQEIMDTLGGQKAAGTGSLDRISQAPYVRQNLALLLGEDEAARYLAQIDARVQQTQRAARVSPNTNSQTFGRAVDEDTFNAASLVGATVDGARAARGDPMAFGRTLDRLRARATMSPADREAIVSMGIADADELENIVQLAQTARTQGRPVPREVRAYIVNARNVLGSRSPVPQQLEQLLLPVRVSAEEPQE